MHRFPLMQLEASPSILGVHDVEARLAKVLNEHPSKTGIVFDQENTFTHRGYQPIPINRDASAATDH